jgi:Spy/CpxP family protein refolding chaperone
MQPHGLSIEEDDMSDFEDAGRPEPAAATGEPMAPMRASRRPGAWSRAGLLGAVLVAGVALGAGGLAAAAAAGPMGWMGGSHLERIQGFVKRAFDGVGATSEQEAKAHDIVAAAFNGMEPDFGKRRELRKQALDLLRAPTIDRAAVEKLRADHMAFADAASKRIVATLLDVAEVLTPEQRARLADRAEAWGPHGPGGHRFGGTWFGGPDRD